MFTNVVGLPHRRFQRPLIWYAPNHSSRFQLLMIIPLFKQLNCISVCSDKWNCRLKRGNRGDARVYILNDDVFCSFRRISNKYKPWVLPLQYVTSFIDQLMRLHVRWTSNIVWEIRYIYREKYWRSSPRVLRTMSKPVHWDFPRTTDSISHLSPQR